MIGSDDFSVVCWVPCSSQKLPLIDRPGNLLEVLPENDFVFACCVELPDYGLSVKTELIVE